MSCERILTIVVLLSILQGRETLLPVVIIIKRIIIFRVGYRTVIIGVAWGTWLLKIDVFLPNFAKCRKILDLFNIVFCPIDLVLRHDHLILIHTIVVFAAIDDTLGMQLLLEEG